MLLELEIAVRFLRRRSGLLLRGTALAAFAGVALAAAALVITLALMNGYSGAIAAALQRGNAHMVGFAADPLDPAEAETMARRMAAVDGVRRATPVTYLVGLMDDANEPTNPLPVVVKAVWVPPAFTELESWPEGELLAAVVGERLAAQTELVAGSRVGVTLPPRNGSWVLPRLQLEVVGTFRLAYAEFDQGWIVVPLAGLLEAMPGAGVAGVEVELDDPMAVGSVRGRLEDAAPTLVISDWREMNRSLFAVLRWQTISLFLVLSLVVAVASFQVSSAMVVLATNKQRSTGMLQALGATPARIRRILLLAGTILGGAGVACGVATGWVASEIMSAVRLIRFPEGLARVYGVDSIPFVVDPLHLVAVVAVCGVLVFAASLWPAWKTSRRDPVAALRAV